MGERIAGEKKNPQKYSGISCLFLIKNVYLQLKNKTNQNLLNTMRRFYLFMMLLAVSMIATAQDKISLNALQLIDRQQTLERHGRLSPSADENRITLVVKVADEGAKETYDAIRSAGGRIEGVLGQ